MLDAIPCHCKDPEAIIISDMIHVSPLSSEYPMFGAVPRDSPLMYHLLDGTS